VRYVDDFVLLDESPQWLNYARAEIEAFLPAQPRPAAQPAQDHHPAGRRGVDFVGQVIKPWRRTLRRRTRNDVLGRIAAMPREAVFESANSYFGLLRQAPIATTTARSSPTSCAAAASSVNGALTQTYRASSRLAWLRTPYTCSALAGFKGTLPCHTCPPEVERRIYRAAWYLLRAIYEGRLKWVNL
jgi:RNA-directed DNA polymerase